MFKNQEQEEIGTLQLGLRFKEITPIQVEAIKEGWIDIRLSHAYLNRESTSLASMYPRAEVEILG